MPDNNKDEKNSDSNQGRSERSEEELRKILEHSIQMTDFRQYVENNIPYEGYVFGIGKTKYFEGDMENPVVLIPDTPSSNDSPTPYSVPNNTANQLANPWFWGGLAYGGFSTYKSFVAFDMCNPWYWTSVKGVRISTQMLGENPATGRFFTGVSGYRIGYSQAFNRAAPLLKTATKISYVGLIIPVAHTIIAGEFNVEDTTDFVFAAVAFIPAVGWVISGLYVVVDTISVLTTEEKISTHVKRLPDRMTMMWVELNQGIKNWINSMCFGVYGIPNL